MSMETWTGVRETMERFKAKHDWSGCLKYLGAENKIPEYFSGSYVLLNELGFVYIHAANDGIRHNTWIALADKALRLSLAMANNKQRIRALKSLAYLYYSEFQGYTQLLAKNITPPFSRYICEKESMTLYEQVLQEGRDIKSLYRLARLLNISANEYRPGCDMKERNSKLKKSLCLYEEALNMYESMLTSPIKRACRQTYIRVCYHASRTCVRLVGAESKFVEGYWIIGGYAARHRIENTRSPCHNMEEEYLVKARKYIDIARNEEDLPADIDDIHAVSMQKQTAEMSWNIYYQMGKVEELAYKKCLLGTTRFDFSKAEKYYRYSCEIDFIRKKEGKYGSTFSYMYIALVELYQTVGQKEAFYRSLDRYRECFQIKTFDLDFYRIKWKMIEHDYAGAENDLAGLARSCEINTIQKKRVEMLMDMLVVISGKEIACLEKKYSPARWEILLELRKYAATYEKENKRQHFYSKLAGVSFGSTQEYIKYLQTGQLLQIKREPDNPFDVNAIAVYNGNYPIGHLKKEVAAHLAPVIDSQQGTVMITVEAVTGGGDHLWGVNISVTLIMHGELTEIEKSAGVYQKTKMDGGGIYMEELYDDEENNEEMDDLAVE